jgi:hypothetical protein
VEIFGYIYTKNPARWNDFRTFYSAGYLLRTHPSGLYDLAQQAAVQDARVSRNGVLMPFYHPSYEALLFVPLSLLPFRAAYGTFMGLMLLCLVGSFYAMRPQFSKAIPLLQSRPGMMMVCFIPAIASIAWGQDSLLFLLLTCLTIKQLQANKDTSAGALLALGLFRFQVTIPLAILLACYRSWRFTVAFLGTAAALLLLSIRLVGYSGFVAWMHVLAATSLIRNQDSSTQHLLKVRPAYMPNLTGLLYVMGTRHLAPQMAFAVVLVASTCVFVWTVWHIRGKSKENVALAMMLLCAVLLSYHLLPYDLGILLPIFPLIATQVRTGVLFALYWLPSLLFLILGGRSLCLYSLPLIVLLVFLGIRKDSPTDEESHSSVEPSGSSIYR